MKHCDKVLLAGTWVHNIKGMIICDKCMDYSLGIIHPYSVYNVDLWCGCATKDADEMARIS